MNTMIRKTEIPIFGYALKRAMEIEKGNYL